MVSGLKMLIGEHNIMGQTSFLQTNWSNVRYFISSTPF